jgi:hypothetical protein
MSETTRFRLHDDVAVVEHDDATRQPREGSEPVAACVTEAGPVYVQVRYAGGDWGFPTVFYQERGWSAWDGMFRWRLVPLCHRRQAPITGEPVADEGDAHREWCTPGCHDESAEADWEMRHPSGVAT